MSIKSFFQRIFGFSPEQYRAGVFLSPTDPRTITSLSGRATPTPGNVVVCLSGGGSRAMIAGMGQLRALAELETANGKSVLSQVKALSTVSGGSWIGATWTHLPAATSDADFVGKYVRDPGRLVRTKTAGHNLAETLDELPEQSAGQTPADIGFGPAALVLELLTLVNVFRVPADMLWQTLMGMHVLEPQGLFSPDLLDRKAPTTFFSLDPATLESDVTDANPSLAKKTAHLVVHPDRPFLVCNMAMFVRSAGTSFEQLAPVQSTPRYTGIIGGPEGTDANDQPVGDGGVTSFGFASTFKAQSGQEVTLAQERQWSLTDAVGTSSAFYAEMLQNLLAGLRSHPERIDGMLQESREEATESSRFSRRPRQARSREDPRRDPGSDSRVPVLVAGTRRAPRQTGEDPLRRRWQPREHRRRQCAGLRRSRQPDRVRQLGDAADCRRPGRDRRRR